MSKKLIIKDDLYGIIELDGVYKELVESEEFQRLKDIVQTGTSYFQFPNMKNETRFKHSVGTFYLICRIIYNIEIKLRQYGIKVNKEELEIAKIAMLLHDIGHGAYSHTLEKITGYSHEKISIDIVKEKDTKIHQILEKYGKENFAIKVGSFLENVYGDEQKEFKTVKLIDGTINLENLLASLISNNIDADRLDYLIRDSKSAGFRILTQVNDLIDSFEFVLDIDEIFVAIPIEKKIFVDMAILERTRNYREIYYCAPSIIGDNIFEFLLEELRLQKEEVPEDILPTIYTFLTNSKASFSTKEYMQITETPIEKVLERISENTKNEKIKCLCDMQQITKSYKVIETDKEESYIRYLLHKAILEISENTKGIIQEVRMIKPYKSNRHEKINIITSNGIEDYKDISQDLINIKPFYKKVIAISMEMIRLELGVSKEEFEDKYEKTLQEVIKSIVKPKEEFELRYVLTNGDLDGQEIKEKIEEKYEIVDSATYFSYDMYYDSREKFELLQNKQALRVRKGTTFHKSEQTYKFKEKRITYKKYKKDNQDLVYTTKIKEEEIGDSENIKDYNSFIKTIGLEEQNLEAILEVKNLRHLYTFNVNGVLIDISFNMAYYKNEIYETFSNVGTIEIKPRENRILDRLSILEFREFLEQQKPELVQFLNNSNIYEIGVLDTYERYKKGYINSEEVEEYEKSYPARAKNLEQILESAKQSKKFDWLDKIPNVEDLIEK